VRAGMGNGMLTKRIIPCLDIARGRTVKGTRFVDLQDAGDPVEQAKRYEREGADELVVLDILATIEGRAARLDLVRAVARELTIPFCVGGGIGRVEDFVNLLRAGCDKVSVNSAAVRRPELISEAARSVGSQCVVVAVDFARNGSGVAEVFLDGGKTPCGKPAVQWIEQAAELGAGEFLLTSIEQDGTRSGFDCDFFRSIRPRVNQPLIASGGAGTARDFIDVFRTGVDAALAAGIFHSGDYSIRGLKDELRAAGLDVRAVDPEVTDAA